MVRKYIITLGRIIRIKLDIEDIRVSYNFVLNVEFLGRILIFSISPLFGL